MTRKRVLSCPRLPRAAQATGNLAASVIEMQRGCRGQRDRGPIGTFAAPDEYVKILTLLGLGCSGGTPGEAGLGGSGRDNSGVLQRTARKNTPEQDGRLHSGDGDSGKGWTSVCAWMEQDGGNGVAQSFERRVDGGGVQSTNKTYDATNQRQARLAA